MCACVRVCVQDELEAMTEKMSRHFSKTKIKPGVCGICVCVCMYVCMYDVCVCVCVCVCVYCVYIMYV